uniref:Uncharacterized protein n=2 Tax=Canis lupus familiaris TaxID=9615 RepID=A0A8I3QCP7_CANLF
MVSGADCAAELPGEQSRPVPTWLLEDCQVGLPARELCVGEHHDTVLGGFVEAKHSLLGHAGTLTDGVHPCDHLILAQAVAGLVLSRAPRVKQQRAPLPLGAASIWAGRALLARLSKGSRLRALALATHTAPTVAADLAILGQARADVCGAVTVVPNVTRVALAFSTVTLAVA